MSSRPDSVSGWNRPSPKNTWWPIVNAAAFRRRLARAALVPVCRRTAEKSAPNLGSMKRRTPCGKAWPASPPMPRESDTAADSPSAWRAFVGAPRIRPVKRCACADAVAAGIAATCRATLSASRSARSPGEEMRTPVRLAAAGVTLDRAGASGVGCTTAARCSAARFTKRAPWAVVMGARPLAAHAYSARPSFNSSRRTPSSTSSARITVWSRASARRQA